MRPNINDCATADGPLEKVRVEEARLEAVEDERKALTVWSVPEASTAAGSWRREAAERRLGESWRLAAAERAGPGTW